VRLTYQQLLGRRVVDCDDRHVGRIVDVYARSDDDKTVHVAGLLVGERALLQRIGRDRWHLKPKDIPWSAVADIDDETIHLRVRSDELSRS
jgi:sporulation protein YlmC with PRC-barrel domain